jgi:NAD-dependent dihydropyrimidine dehydrogenase PreA subunit/predicted hydrocarbon binding protein
MTIEIRVDEKSCVGCSLCVETCPTNVLEFNESEALPEVKKPAECFGCLSCAEICPATALDHGSIALSECYYHDPAALDIASKLGVAPRAINAPTENEDAVLRAKTDLGIRLLSVAAVLKQTLGQSLAAIGTQAGRSLAMQLPRYQKPQSIEEALQLAKSVFSPAWNIEFDLQDKNCPVRITSCFIRELCQKQGMELGGDLCTLFYGYFAGYIAKMASVRPRLMNAERGANECRYSIQLYPAAGG